MNIIKFFCGIKYLFAQLIAFILHNQLERRNIWIFSEKKTEARDNGYHFFKYIIEHHPEIEAYYVICKGAADENKVKLLGPTIEYDSLMHCIYYAIAKERICSQIHGVKPFEEYSGLVARLTLYRRRDQRQINLKHGVSKDLLPAFDFRKMGYDLYIAAVKSEYEYVKKQFDYPDKNIAATGFCRFDALHQNQQKEKLILIMPTFRKWLKTSDSSKKVASIEEMNKFEKSEYYKFYHDLLSSSGILNIVKYTGYKVIFYLHYTFQPYIDAFKDLASDQIIIADRYNYDVQDLLLRTSLLITDYSSVFFDFAYMNKPIIYAHFDYEEYRGKHYKEGMFSYERDGFGPICTTISEIITEVEKISSNNFKIDAFYQNRIDTFFVPHDNHNCERVFSAILNLDK